MHLSFRQAFAYFWIKSHAILLVLEEAKQKVAETDLLLITQAAVGKLWSDEWLHTPDQYVCWDFAIGIKYTVIRKIPAEVTCWNKLVLRCWHRQRMSVSVARGC